jgi:hypothetical protein
MTWVSKLQERCKGSSMPGVNLENVPPCLRRSACPPHKALGGGATRRQAQGFFKDHTGPTALADPPVDYYLLINRFFSRTEG